MVDDTSIEQKPALWEQLFTAYILFLSTGSVIPLLHKESTIVFNFTQGDIIKILWLGFYAITLFLLLLHFRRIIRIAVNAKLICLLVGLTFISVVWSEAPVVTLRCSLIILGTTAFGIYLAIRYSRQEVLKLLVWSLGLSAVLSLGVVLLFPSYGIQDSGAWRGVYGHKNGFGLYMTLAALSWLLYSYSYMKGRLVGFSFCVMSILLLLLAKSATALVVFSLLLILLFLSLLTYPLVRWRSIWATFLLILIILSVVSSVFWLVNNLDIVLAILGRNITLTGRTVLWQAVWDMIQKRPWLGYGYGAFWLGWEGPSSYIWHMLSWEPKTAHNGYLNLWLQLGFVGVVIFILSLFSNLLKAFALVYRKSGLEKIFPLLFFAFMMLLNITESFILVRNSMFWILYVAISLQLEFEYSILQRPAARACDYTLWKKVSSCFGSIRLRYYDRLS